MSPKSRFTQTGKTDKIIVALFVCKKEATMEIERKFTLNKAPDNLESYTCHVIEQAYLNTAPVIRIRKQDDKYYFTYKGGGLMAREEYNLPLNKESYEHLLTKADGNIISKKRYVIPLQNPRFKEGYIPSDKAKEASLVVELDIFEKPFAPLIMAEVEFPDIDMANAFIAPDWFKEDVTNDPRYHNSYMSRRVFE